MVKTGKRSIDKIGRKFISLPITGRILKKGDKDNNLYFIGYIKGKSFVREKWCDKESWLHLNIRETRRGAKGRAKKKGMEFNVSVEYLKSIFPDDNFCPIFGTEMSFGNTSKWKSASLDRIDTDEGYIEGNVQWISTKANTLKNNAHPFELLRLANYTVKQLKEKNESKKK